MRSIRKDQKGFTLIEVLIVIAVAAVLAAIATPSIKSFMDSYTTKGAARDVISMFQQARLEAVRRGEPVALSFTLGTGSAGQVKLFVDDGAVAFTQDVGELTISTYSMPRNTQLQNSLDPLSPPFPGLVTGFDSRGLTRVDSGDILDGSIEVAGLSKPYTLSLGLSGLAKIE